MKLGEKSRATPLKGEYLEKPWDAGGRQPFQMSGHISDRGLTNLPDPIAW
jgi:hypothetical protein